MCFYVFFLVQDVLQIKEKVLTPLLLLSSFCLPTASRLKDMIAALKGYDSRAKRI